MTKPHTTIWRPQFSLASLMWLTVLAATATFAWQEHRGHIQAERILHPQGVFSADLDVPFPCTTALGMKIHYLQGDVKRLLIDGAVDHEALAARKTLTSTRTVTDGRKPVTRQVSDASGARTVQEWIDDRSVSDAFTDEIRRNGIQAALAEARTSP